MNYASALQLSAAEKLTEGALAKARELGLSISVAVVDPGGHIKRVVRMDGAGWFSPETALGKAFAAVAFRRDADEMVQRLDSQERQHLFGSGVAPLSGGRLVLGKGGCVVKDGDTVLGGIGVSGALADEDEVCAKAGIANLLGGG